MTVYLVQHAEAMPEEENPDRPLTDRGRTDTERVAALASRLSLDVANIYHSGKLRAQQTAEILADALSPSHGVEARDDIGPVDDVTSVADGFADAKGDVMLVGHLPFMERIVAYMVTGDADATVVSVQNAAINCVSRDDDGWAVDWILTPSIARA